MGFDLWRLLPERMRPTRPTPTEPGSEDACCSKQGAGSSADAGAKEHAAGAVKHETDLHDGNGALGGKGAGSARRRGKGDDTAS